MRTISRRAAMAAIPIAAASTSLPAMAELLPANSAGADPIFAAIEEYKVAFAVCEATRSAWDHLDNGPEKIAADAVHQEAFWSAWDAADALFTTTPTTIAGVAALLDQLALSPYREEGDEGPPDRERGVQNVLHMQLDNHPKLVDEFLPTLASALRAMSGASSSRTA